MTRQIGGSLTRVLADAGYRGHNAPRSAGLRVITAGQKRGVTEAIQREMRRRSAIEPVIGHLKSDHRMDRNHLAGRRGDATNAVLAAAGYNFRLLLAWLATLLHHLLAVAIGGKPETTPVNHGANRPSSRLMHVFHGRLDRLIRNTTWT